MKPSLNPPCSLFTNIAITSAISQRYFSNQLFLGLTALIASVLLSQTTLAQCSKACNLVWQDEFNGNQVDDSKWEFQTGRGVIGTGDPGTDDHGLWAWGNGELQTYETSNATVNNGHLTITAKKDDGGHAYTSSRLRTKNKAEWTYGRIEMRAKLPTGQGLWPAFWMLPSNSPYGGWAASGEIDIMESKGRIPNTIHGTIHYGGEWCQAGCNQYTGATFDTPTSPTDDFYTYAVEWTTHEFRWYIKDDSGSETRYAKIGSWYSEQGTYPAPFDTDFHILLNLAVGGQFDNYLPPDSAAFPSEFIVDYVRVYAFEDPTTQAASVNLRGETVIIDDMESSAPANHGWATYPNGQNNHYVLPFSANPETIAGSQSIKVYFDRPWWENADYYGVVTKNFTLDVSNTEALSFWINPGGDSYDLGIKLLDDDNNDGGFDPAIDEEYKAICRVSPTGPCASSGGGWQQVVIPIEDFYRDSSYATGGNGILDTQTTNGNGQVVSIAVTVNHIAGNPSFYLDQFAMHLFPEPEPDTEAFDVPIPVWALIALSLLSLAVHFSARRRH